MSEATEKRVEFTDEQMKRFEEIITHYPEDRRKSAIIPTLYIAQEAYGNITPEAMRHVAELLEITPAKVKEVFSFYTYFRRAHTGKYRIDVCCTLSCALRGAQDILKHIEEKYDVKPGGTSEDGKVSILKVECIAACDKGPAIQINGKYYEDLTVEKLDEILEEEIK